jgi:hypothetical protein
MTGSNRGGEWMCCAEIRSVCNRNTVPPASQPIIGWKDPIDLPGNHSGSGKRSNQPTRCETRAVSTKDVLSVDIYINIYVL